MSSIDIYFGLLKEESMIAIRIDEIKKEKKAICKKIWKECIHDWEKCPPKDTFCTFPFLFLT